MLPSSAHALDLIAAPTTLNALHELGAPHLTPQSLADSDSVNDGTVTEYYPSGALKKVAHYEDGQLMGLCCGYYENGQLKYEIPYEHDLCSGLARTFHEDGQLKCEQAITYDEHGRSCGYVRTYYESGQLSSSSLHQHGHVTTRQFYASGKTLLSTMVIDGLTEGTTIWYYESGAIKRTLPFSHSLIDGIAYEYYENGIMARATSFRHDLLHGDDQYFDRQGKLITTRHYDKGKLISCD